MMSTTVVWRDVGHLIAASSIASVHFLSMPREEFGNCSLEVNECTSVAQESSQRGFGLRGEAAGPSSGPSLHSWLCIPPWSNVASHDEPPFVLSLHLMFCGMLMHPMPLSSVRLA